MKERYIELNKLAGHNGTVIFGGDTAFNIPLAELKQTFALKGNYYNRSFEGLSVADAGNIYSLYAAELQPDTVLVHIGDNDIEMFINSPREFTDKYRSLIYQIKENNSKCQIAVISLKNYINDKNISELNESLKNIAESENCEFCDISKKGIWNPKQIKEVNSFIYDIGFIRPLKIQRPIYDLVKILFSL